MIDARLRTVVLVLLSVPLLAAGCAKMIGDDCGSSVDCDPGQICDTALPGGYCTVTPCEPDSCPGEAVCIEYPPFLSYCMRRCNGDGDCRGGYVCIKPCDAKGDSTDGNACSGQGIQYCGVPDEAPVP